MKVIVHHVNAFTADSEGGNAAGVVLDADALNESQMLAIAKEVGFSETAFISGSSLATRKLRFFTPTEEVDLCGHATIASWSLMLQQHLVNTGISTQETLAGLLKVNVGTNGLIFMEQTDAKYFEIVAPSNIKSILHIEQEDFHATLKPQVVSTGLKDLIVILKNEIALYNVRPDFKAMEIFSKEHDITGMHVACMLNTQATFAIARNFAPIVGINEESATGTSNGALLCYLKKYDALPINDVYRIEQGKSMGQTSHIYGKFENKTVWIGGNATVMKRLEITV